MLALKPPNWEIVSSQDPLLEAMISSQAPHFGNQGHTPLPEKVRVPSRGVYAPYCKVIKLHLNLNREYLTIKQ